MRIPPSLSSSATSPRAGWGSQFLERGGVQLEAKHRLDEDPLPLLVHSPELLALQQLQRHPSAVPDDMQVRVSHLYLQKWAREQRLVLEQPAIWCGLAAVLLSLWYCGRHELAPLEHAGLVDAK